ncbi:MAG: hypothetical protein AAGG68_16680 [Bacteroidota bacterium]
MQKDFTLEDLVSLLYGEVSTSERLAMYEALEAQPALLAEFEQLSQAKQRLPKVAFSPSKDTIKEILAYGEHRTLV